MKLSAAILMLAATALSGAEPLLLKSTVPLPGVKGRFDHFAIDVKGNRLFVAALGNNTLEVVDVARGKRLQSVSGMSKPTGVLYLPESNQVLVANGDSGTLQILDGPNLRLKRTVPELPDADNLRFDPKNKLAWLGYGDGALAMLPVAGSTAPPGEQSGLDEERAGARNGLQPLATIKLPAHPESFQLEKEGSRIFVNLPDARQVAVVDRDKRAIRNTWPMEKFHSNFPMALDEPNHRLFVGCRTPPRLVVLDTITGNPVADLAISGDTDDLFYDAKRKLLYISCGEGFIDIISQTSPDKYQRITKIPTSAGARTSFFSPDLDHYYLAVPERGNQKAEIRIYQPP